MIKIRLFEQLNDMKNSHYGLKTSLKLVKFWKSLKQPTLHSLTALNY